MSIMDTKSLSSEIENEVKQFSKTCIIRPSVALISIGEDEIGKRITKLREDACNRTGIYFRYYEFDDNTPELTIINKIKELNNDDYVNGIVVSLPIPEKYNEKRILNTIINSKDIDGVTDINVGRLISGRKSIVPCAAQAIMELIQYHDISIAGRNTVVLGNDRLIGRPISNMLINECATVTVCNSNTLDIEKYTKDADIVISCMNSKELIKDSFINKECVVIDAGITIEGDKVFGDIDYSKVSKKAKFITPKEDGIEELSLAMFLKNIIFCYNNKK